MNTQQKIPKGSFIFCIIMAIISLTIAATLQVKIHNETEGLERIDAVVTSVGEIIYVTYEFNGTTYEDMPVVMTQGAEVGKTISVYIDPANPGIAASKDTNTSMFIAFLVVAVIMLVAGVAGLIVRKHILGKDYDAIIERNKYIYAIVDNVVYETSITDEEGRHPFFIHCHYEDFNGKTRHKYVSPPIYTNPNKYLEANKNQVKIYIKGKNYRKYRFDVKQFDM